MSVGHSWSAQQFVGNDKIDRRLCPGSFCSDKSCLAAMRGTASKSIAATNERWSCARFCAAAKQLQPPNLCSLNDKKPSHFSDLDTAADHAANMQARRTDSMPKRDLRVRLSAWCGGDQISSYRQLHVEYRGSMDCLELSLTTGLGADNGVAEL